MFLNKNSLECIEMDESGDIFLNPKYGKKLFAYKKVNSSSKDFYEGKIRTNTISQILKTL